MHSTEFIINRYLAFHSLLSFTVMHNAIHSDAQCHSPRCPFTATQGIRPPAQSIRPPTRSIRPPTQSVRAPTQRIRPPTQSNRPPTQLIRPPTQSISLPTHRIRPPTQRIRPPTKRIHPPTRTIRPPSQSISPPADSERSFAEVHTKPVTTLCSTTTRHLLSIAGSGQGANLWSSTLCKLHNNNNNKKPQI